jgi:tetratricopeptide (TPR) repeat protein
VHHLGARVAAYLTTRHPQRGALSAGLAAAAVLVYLNSLANGFALDDVYIIQRNARVHDITALRNILLTPYWPFFGTELGLWRPFAIFGYAVQWAVGGGAPWVFHGWSITLHALVTVLVFMLLERLTATGPAFAGALLFAVHPVHTEAVANVVGQAELIVAAALVGACLIHAARPPGLELSWARRLGILLLFSIALYTKEHAVVLPGLLVITDLAQRRVDFSRHGLAAYVHVLLMPVFLLGASVALYLILRFEVLGGALFGIDAGPDYPFLRGEYRLLNGLRAFPEFLRLLVFPLDLAHDYSPAMILPVESLTPMTAVGAVLLLGLGGLALLTPWKPAVGFPAAWFLISIAPVANLFFPIGVLIAERTLYLPSIAASAALAFAWTRLAASRVPVRRAASALLLLAVVLMGVRTWIRNPDWRSTWTIVASLMRDHPTSYKAQWVYAGIQAQLGNTEAAAVHYEVAYRIYPHASQMMTEYGRFLIGQRDYEKAAELLEQANAMHDYVPNATALLAYAYIQIGRFEDALLTTVRAERLGIDLATFLALRAYAYEGLERRQAAVQGWRGVVRVARVNRHLATAHLARALALTGDVDGALEVLETGSAAFAGDSAALPIILRTEQAVRQGCYSADAERGNPSQRVPRIAQACDPLPPFFALPEPSQNAPLLQNATPAAGF